MENLKKFLEDLTDSGVYYAELVESIAEISIMGDAAPVVFLELQEGMYHINIRCDVPPRITAQIIYDMTILDEDIVIGPDFFVDSNEGVLYGEKATALFLATVFNTMEEMRDHHEVELDNVLFVVKQPIYTYGNNHDKKNKMQRLWGNNLE